MPYVNLTVNSEVNLNETDVGRIRVPRETKLIRASVTGSVNTVVIPAETTYSVHVTNLLPRLTVNLAEMNPAVGCRTFPAEAHTVSPGRCQGCGFVG
jgi:hypothetical protein